MDLIRINIVNLCISFKIYNLEKKIFKKQLLNKLFKTKKENKLDSIDALKNINFSLSNGERLGIIGKNGSGKTTLLRAISKIYEPTTGIVETSGIIKNVLEVGASGQIDDTVENNILLIGLLHGHKKKDILRKKEEIINFSGLRNFLKLPMISCSTGMQLRLLFSTLYHFPSDIYIIDEFISTGDADFRKKGMELLDKFIMDKILIFASHDMKLIKEKCNKILVLDNGEQKFFGEVDQGIEYYKNI